MTTTRLFGVETEYAVSGLGREGAPIDRQRLLEEMMHAAGERLIHLRQPVGAGLFVGNGGRLYVDGHHLEFSTPECAHPDDVVRFVRAGDRIVGDLAAAVVAKRSDLGEVVILRSNVDYTDAESTWGSHESYMHRVEPALLPRQLIPHLVSRIIFSGAGGFVGSPARDITFTLSPRVRHLQTAISSASTHARGIFHSKDETLAAGDYHRLHVICGESLCSDTALWLRIGTTALVVALIEAGIGVGEGVQVGSAVAAMQTFASDPSCRATASLDSGTPITAIAIQRHYLALAREHLAHSVMPEWAPVVCERWGAILDRLAAGPDSVAAALDWAAKLALFRRHAQRRDFEWRARESDSGESEGVERPGAMQLSLRFDRPPRLASAVSALTEAHNSAAALEAARILHNYQRLQQELFEIDMRFGQLGERSLFGALQRAGVVCPPLVDDAAAARAIDRPPAIGRAAIRGNAIRALHARGVAGSCDWTGVWDHARDRGLDLLDPLAARVRWRSNWALDRLRRGQPGAPRQSLHDHGVALYHAGNHEAALQLLLRVANERDDGARDGEVASARFWAATALRNRGRLGEAEAVLDDLVRAGACDDLIYKALARRAVITAEMPRPRRDIEAAIEAAERHVVERGHSEWRSRILLARARFLEARGLYDEALAVAVEGLERQAVEHNGIAVETHMRTVLALCLRAGRLADVRTYLEAWMSGPLDGNDGVQVLVFCGRSELARADGDALAAVHWSECATNLSGPMAFYPVRRMVGETHVRALLCQGNLVLAHSALRTYLPWRAIESGTDRYNARLLWADYHLACAQRAAEVPIVDPVRGASFASTPADGRPAVAARAIHRGARAYDETLHEGRALDALLDCDVREREIAERRRLVERTQAQIAALRAGRRGAPLAGVAGEERPPSQ